jgi:trans-aconitate 2-methyltransferase
MMGVTAQGAAYNVATSTTYIQYGSTVKLLPLTNVKSQEFVPYNDASMISSPHDAHEEEQLPLLHDLLRAEIDERIPQSVEHLLKQADDFLKSNILDKVLRAIFYLVTAYELIQKHSLANLHFPTINSTLEKPLTTQIKSNTNPLIYFSRWDNTSIYYYLLTEHPELKNIVAVNELSPGFPRETAAHNTLNNNAVNVAKLIITLQSNNQYLLDLTQGIGGRDGQTLLHIAAEKGFEDIVDCLLQHPQINIILNALKNKIDVNGEIRGESALHLAAKEGHFAIIRKLIRVGANTEIANVLGWTPFEVLVRDCQVKDFEEQDKLACELLAKKPSSFIEQPNQRLIEAALKSALLKTTQGLLAKGLPKQNIRELSFVEIACHELFMIGTHKPSGLKAKAYIELIRWLVLQGADPNENFKNWNGNLMHRVCEAGDYNLVKFLLEQKIKLIDITILSRNRKNILHFAASSRRDCVDVIQLLLQNPQSHLLLTQVDDNQRLPLHYAAQFGNVGIIKLLTQNVTSGKQINAVDFDGNTPLHMCAMYANSAFQINKSIDDYAETVAELRNLGADTSIRNKENKTPLDLARNSDSDVEAVVKNLTSPLKPNTTFKMNGNTTVTMVSNLQPALKDFQPRKEHENKLRIKCEQHRFVVVTGISGSGKTQLVAYHFNETKYADWIKYKITCKDIDSIRASLVAILSLPLDNITFDFIMNKMLSCFAINDDKKFVLIFDGVDEERPRNVIKRLAETLINNSRNIYVVVTTINKNFYFDNRDDRLLPIDGFSTDEARSFFKDVWEKDPNTCSTIINRFDRLPLGLAAAKFSMIKFKDSPSEYLKKLDYETSRREVEIAEEKYVRQDYDSKIEGGRYLRAAIRICVNNLNDQIKQFFQGIAILNNEKIPINLMKTLCGDGYNNILLALEEASLVNISDFWRMHKITQETLLPLLFERIDDPTQFEDFKGKFLEPILTFFAKEYEFTRDTETAKKAEQLTSHLAPLMQFFSTIILGSGEMKNLLAADTVNNFLDLMLNFSVHFIRTSQFETAENILKTFEALFDKNRGRADLQKKIWQESVFEFNYAWLGLEIDCFDGNFKVLQRHKKSYELKTKYIENNNLGNKLVWQRRLVISLYNYALALLSQYEITGEGSLVPEALPLLQECEYKMLKIRKNEFERDGSEKITSKDLLHVEIQLCNAWSLYHLHAGEYHEAMKIAGQGLEKIEEQYPESFLDMVLHKRNGICSLKLGEFSSALTHFDRALGVFKEKLTGGTYVAHLLEINYRMATAHFEVDNFKKSFDHLTEFERLLKSNELEQLLHVRFVEEAKILKENTILQLGKKKAGPNEGLIENKVDLWDGQRYHSGNDLQFTIATDLLSNTLQPKENKRWCDLGCGDGRIASYISKKYHAQQVKGYDSSQSMIEFANANYKGQNIALSFSCKSMQQLNVDQRYDYVVSFFAIHWLTNEDKELVLKKVQSLLKSGGYFLGLVASQNNLALARQIVIKQDKWRNFFSNFPSENNNEDETAFYFNLIKRDAFGNILLNRYNHEYIFEDREKFFAFLRGYNQEYAKLPQGHRDQFVEDIAKVYLGQFPPDTKTGYIKLSVNIVSLLYSRPILSNEYQSIPSLTSSDSISLAGISASATSSTSTSMSISTSNADLALQQGIFKKPRSIELPTQDEMQLNYALELSRKETEQMASVRAQRGNDDDDDNESDDQLADDYNPYLSPQ